MAKLSVAAHCAVLLFAAAACFALQSAPAFAASSYDDVPADHWAYNSLEYLSDQGVLEGYPDGYFKGDRTLTRYEFAQAIARMLDTVEDGPGDASVEAMMQSLRTEFSDQLAEIDRKLDASTAQVQDLDMRVSDIEGLSMDSAERVAALEDKVLGLKPGPAWWGVFAYRFNFDEQAAGVGGAERNNLSHRILFILGYSKQINDAVSVNFRFKTGSNQIGRVPSVDLGNDGRTHSFALDQAYVKYSPSWFGYYSKCDDGCDKCGDCDECAPCKDCIPKLDIYAGIFPNLTYDPYELVLDQDLQMQGLGFVYHFNDDFQITSLADIYVETDGGDFFDDDTVMYACELRHDNLFTDCLDVWVSCYSWENESALGEPHYLYNRLHGFDFNNDGVFNGDDRFSTDFRTVKVGAQYELGCIDDKSVTVLGEYMVNIDSDAEDRINSVNPFVDPDIIYETSDDIGWQAALRYGAEPKYCGEWNMHLRYKEIGANAIVSGVGDGEAGWANTNSFEANWRYMFADSSNVTLTYINNKMHNAFGFAIPANAADRQLVQVDLGFRF